MMKSVRNSSKLVMLAMIILLSAFGCQSKKKAMQATNAAKEKARIEQEAALKKKNEEEEARRREAEERARREAESKPIDKEEVDESTTSEAARLSQYFAAIASSGNVASANSSIKEALALFASPETPVLIVISEENGQKDYDKPTTIKDYLNYLKDQKKNNTVVSDLKVNGTGKITELELKKNF